MKNFKNKKSLILFVLFLMLLALPIYLYSIYTNTNTITKKNPSPHTDKKISMQPDPSAYPTYPEQLFLNDLFLPQPPLDWITGDNSRFSLKFPKEWQPQTSNVINNGVNVVIKPNDGKPFPRFNLESAPINPEITTEQKIAELKKLVPLNYSQIKTQLKGQEAIQVNEVLPITDDQGNNLYKTYIFLSKEKTYYIMTFAYFNDENAEKNKVTLLSILNSVVLK